MRIPGYRAINSCARPRGPGAECDATPLAIVCPRRRPSQSITAPRLLRRESKGGITTAARSAAARSQRLRHHESGWDSPNLNCHRVPSAAQDLPENSFSQEEQRPRPDLGCLKMMSSRMAQITRSNLRGRNTGEPRSDTGTRLPCTVRCTSKSERERT